MLPWTSIIIIHLLVQAVHREDLQATASLWVPVLGVVLNFEIADLISSSVHIWQVVQSGQNVVTPIVLLLLLLLVAIGASHVARLPTIGIVVVEILRVIVELSMGTTLLRTVLNAAPPKLVPRELFQQLTDPRPTGV